VLGDGMIFCVNMVTIPILLPRHAAGTPHGFSGARFGKSHHHPHGAAGGTTVHVPHGNLLGFRTGENNPVTL